MPDLVLARVVHVLSVVLWIGGVAFATTVLIPAIRKLPTDAARIELFERLESRFALQSRVTTLLAGASGLYMIHTMGAWSRYLDSGVARSSPRSRRSTCHATVVWDRLGIVPRAGADGRTRTADLLITKHEEE